MRKLYSVKFLYEVKILKLCSQLVVRIKNQGVKYARAISKNLRIANRVSHSLSLSCCFHSLPSLSLSLCFTYSADVGAFEVHNVRIETQKNICV